MTKLFGLLSTHLYLKVLVLAAGCVFGLTTGRSTIVFRIPLIFLHWNQALLGLEHCVFSICLTLVCCTVNLVCLKTLGSYI